MEMVTSIGKSGDGTGNPAFSNAMDITFERSRWMKGDGVFFGN